MNHDHYINFSTICFIWYSLIILPPKTFEAHLFGGLLVDLPRDRNRMENQATQNPLRIGIFHRCCED